MCKFISMVERMEMMDWGVVSGLAALVGVIINFIRIGRWQGNIETRVSILEKTFDHHDIRMKELTTLISKQNDLLTEVKIKLEMLFEKKKRGKND